ncbi:HEAT repeat domain-containing protein [Nocardia sp. NBC_00416]|uniref:HEAT repeat domain-containing protein n=1 Tax=Nocardia sp. NBC_00416 TaxID=2975991 RepID=UPI002E1D7E0E
MTDTESNPLIAERADSTEWYSGVSLAESVVGVKDAIESLLPLVGADWHESHENIVTLLERIASPSSVPALRYAAEYVPEYLEYDENRAMARKAVHALRKIPGAAAEAAMVELLDSDSEVVRDIAAKQLVRRRS